MVVINLEGFSVSLCKTLAKKLPFFFSSSMCILLDEINAISIPEKKAESIMETTIMKSCSSNSY
jgi:hypothetical protein